MTIQPRYAIYLAPKPETQLWQFGSKVLGYDAASGQETAGFRLPSIDKMLWKKVSARARNYGFHATLKAPFRLAAAFSEADLIGGLEAFAATRLCLPNIRLKLSVLDGNESGGFLALTPEKPEVALNQLEEKAVTQMDQFRATLSNEDIAKRKPELLSKRQRDYLAAYGYPYVLEEYRAHFTLSDRLPEASKAAAELDDLMIGHIGIPSIQIDELVLFKQADENTPFRIIARAPLGAKQN